MNKRKLTPSERLQKKKRKATTRIIFVNGRQKRVLREPTICGLPVDEFIAQNADPIWLHQNEMWEFIPAESDTASHRPPHTESEAFEE